MTENKVWDYVSKKNGKDCLAEQVEKHGKKVVMTNPEMAKHLLARIKFNKGDRVLEPCRGDGAFFNNFPEYTINDWCEINENKDFLTYDKCCEYTIANPPFIPRKLFWAFHQNAMRITTKEIYWLINMSALNVFTPKRLGEMAEKNWYIEQFHIVADKRWFGRYVWVKITRTPNTIISYHKNVF